MIGPQTQPQPTPSSFDLLQRHPEILLLVRGRRVDALTLALVDHGGLITADELIRRLRTQCDQPISQLARWIVDREILSFREGPETLIPRFQFDETCLLLREGMSAMNRELLQFLDDWEAVAWFMEANAWLDERVPMVLLASHPLDLCAAARAARFAVRG